MHPFTASHSSCSRLSSPHQPLGEVTEPCWHHFIGGTLGDRHSRKFFTSLGRCRLCSHWLWLYVQRNPKGAAHSAPSSVADCRAAQPWAPSWSLCSSAFLMSIQWPSPITPPWLVSSYSPFPSPCLLPRSGNMAFKQRVPACGS